MAFFFEHKSMIVLMPMFFNSKREQEWSLLSILTGTLRVPAGIFAYLRLAITQVTEVLGQNIDVVTGGFPHPVYCWAHSSGNVLRDGSLSRWSFPFRNVDGGWGFLPEDEIQERWKLNHFTCSFQLWVLSHLIIASPHYFSSHLRILVGRSAGFYDGNTIRIVNDLAVSVLSSLSSECCVLQRWITWT